MAHGQKTFCGDFVVILCQVFVRVLLLKYELTISQGKINIINTLTKNNFKTGPSQQKIISFLKNTMLFHMVVNLNFFPL